MRHVLKIIVECGLTKSTWEKQKHIFKDAPSYSVVVKEKKKCRPSRPMAPTGTSVLVHTQDLVNHTVDRILCDKSIIKHVAELKETYGSVELQFIYKYGLDGSGVKNIHLWSFVYHLMLKN